MTELTIEQKVPFIQKQIALYRFLDAHPELQEFQNELNKDLNNPHLTQAQKCIILQTKLIEQKNQLEIEFESMQKSVEQLSNEMDKLLNNIKGD